MANLTLEILPEFLLYKIFVKCEPTDLAALSLSCTTFYNIITNEVLWKTMCLKALQQKKVDLGKVKSYQQLYTNLLHKYLPMLGVYQVQIGHYGSLLEIRYREGNIEGISIEGSFNSGEIFENLTEETYFTIKGDIVPPEHVCLPEDNPHACIVEADRQTRVVKYRCLCPEEHKSALNRLLENAVTGPKISKLEILMNINKKPLVSKPLFLPSPSDIPASLLMPNGTIPSQIITPGIFKGDYSVHGVELILFKYVSDNELHGFKVTGDPNIPAGKISIKCYLDYPVHPTLEEQMSVNGLGAMEKEKRKVPLYDLPKQTFKAPEDLYDDELASAHAPGTCMARYHGKCQIADHNYRNRRYIEAQVVVFNNDLIGVILFELSDFFLFSRAQRPFLQLAH